MKAFYTLLILLIPLVIFSQCVDPIACNYDDNGECIYDNGNDIIITNNIWLQEIDQDCDGTIDLIFYAEYYSNGSYSWGYEYNQLFNFESSWSLCNNEFNDNYDYNGTVNSDGNIEGLIASTLEPACDWACWRMTPVTSSDIYGCIDEIACNYNSYANISDNSCIYIETCNSFNQIINNDNDICIEGCCQENALNYNPDATLCDYDLCIVGASYNGPESVDYDSNSDRYLISNSMDGKILSYDLENDELEVFVSGIGSGPHGLEVIGNEVYVCSGSYLKAYDLQSGLLTVNINLGATFANGITHKGNDVFITDFSGQDIYRYNIINGSFNKYIENMSFMPNGIIYDDIGDRLLLVGWEDLSPIIEIDLNDSTFTYFSSDLSYCDGITMDNNGDFYISNWGNNTVNKFISDFSETSTIVVPNMNNPGDVYYNRLTGTLAVPNSGNNTVVFVDFSGCTDPLACNYNDDVSFDNGSCVYDSFSNEEISSCDEIIWNGQIISETGEYFYDTINVNGCDSIVSLDFILNSDDYSIDNVMACTNYFWNDSIYLESGMYTFEGTNSNGCDSTVIIDLTIYEPISENIIYGNPEPDPFSVSLYSASNNGNNLVWIVDGGNIIENDGNSINIQWGNQGIGLITLVESNDICNDFTNVFTVDIGGQIEPTWDCNANFACIEQSNGSGNFQSLEDCEANCSLVESNWECNANFACIEQSDGSGNFQSLEDCEANCSFVEPTWDCNANFACIEQSDGSGNFQSLEDCEANCSLVESTWECNANFACIEQSDGSGNFQSLEECEANCSAIELTFNCIFPLNNGDGYCDELLDGTGEFSTLEDCEQECQNVSSINENIIDVNIYPNPSSNIFNLEFYSDSETEISVTNILGEQIYFESIQSNGEFNTQIDLSKYSKSIYNLTIKTSEGLSNYKLILQ